MGLLYLIVNSIEVFHVLIYSLYIIFIKKSLHSFCPLSNWIVCFFSFLTVEFESSFYIVDIILLSGM